VRIVITGATGNFGTSLVSALASDPQFSSIVGIARRLPAWRPDKTSWVQADVAADDLAPHFCGADAVVHLAWLIQPSHREDILRRTNIDGSARVMEAVAKAGVQTLVHASSVGTYSPGPKNRPVEESWPSEGIATSPYSRHKAAVERMLDVFEAANAHVRVVRLRPGLIFQREAASGIRRLFLGPFFPNVLLRPGLVPVVPDVATLRFQAVHSIDVAEAARLALLRPVRGAFNVAAEPVLDGPALAAVLSARPIRMPEAPLRMAASATWRLHLQPSDVGWVDLAMRVPIMSTARARDELGWAPRFTAIDALRELLAGLRDGAGFATPPLEPGGKGPLRLWEITTGVGSREAA